MRVFLTICFLITLTACLTLKKSTSKNDYNQSCEKITFKGLVMSAKCARKGGSDNSTLDLNNCYRYDANLKKLVKGFEMNIDCTDVRISGHTLYAKCQNKQVNTDLLLGVDNKNGGLVCSPYPY